MKFIRTAMAVVPFAFGIRLQGNGISAPQNDSEADTSEPEQGMYQKAMMAFYYLTERMGIASYKKDELALEFFEAINTQASLEDIVAILKQPSFDINHAVPGHHVVPDDPVSPWIARTPTPINLAICTERMDVLDIILNWSYSSQRVAFSIVLGRDSNGQLMFPEKPQQCSRQYEYQQRKFINEKTILKTSNRSHRCVFGIFMRSNQLFAHFCFPDIVFQFIKKF